MGYITIDYLKKQFSSYSALIKTIFSGKVEQNKDNKEDVYKLDIYNTDGKTVKFTTPNLLNTKINTISVDGTALTIDENKNVNIDLTSKANDADLADIAKSGDYKDLINTPTIATKVS